jgi:hypothetical protein
LNTTALPPPPRALQVLAFLGGALLLVGGFVTGWVNLGTVQPFKMAVDVLLQLLGGVIVALEVKSALCTKHVAAVLEEYCQFLHDAQGRGWYALALTFTLTLTLHPHPQPHPRPRAYFHPHPHPHPRPHPHPQAAAGTNG